MELFNVLTNTDGRAQVYLYGNVGEGERVDASVVVAQLMELENQYHGIDIHINSNGGDVFNGMAIYNALKQSKADIKIYVDGIAASIASIIALCGKPLYMSQYARLMLHAVQGGAYGNSSELKKVAGMIEDIQSDLAAMVSKKCGMDKDAIYQSYFADEKDHWITAKEALQMGIIDGIVQMDEEEGTPEADANAEAIQAFFNNRLSLRESLINNNMILDKIKNIEAFKDAADENEVLDIFQGLSDKAVLADSLKEENESLKEENLNLKNQLQEMNDKADEAIIDGAIKEGKIKDEQKATFCNLLKADRENTLSLIDSLEAPKVDEPKPQPKPIAKASEVFDDKSTAGFEAMTWDEMDKKGLLVELKNTNIELFKNKYKAQFGVEYIND